MFRRGVLLVSCFLFTAAGAAAQEAPGGNSLQGLSLGVSAGTTGIGPELGIDAGEKVGLRVTSGYFKISRHITVDDVKYDGKLTLGSLGILADVYPFASGFRATGGAFYNGNKIDISAAPSSAVTIGNTTYSAAQVGRLDSRIKYNQFSPYAGLGFTTNRSGKGFSLISDIGILFQGRSKTTLTATGAAASNPAFAADLERERLSLAKDADKLRFWPVLRTVLAYRF